MAQQLNGALLSRGYESESQVHLGSQIEIDVATHEENGAPKVFGSNGSYGGVATEVQTYAPPAPAISGAVAFSDADVFEVRVYKNDGVWKLIAAVELVIPANKDRPSTRRAFATKVASYLQKGVSIVVVDTVTSRLANLHDDLVELLHLKEHFDWHAPSGLSAIAYRTMREPDREPEGERLDVWPYQLKLGEPLPTVPLWLSAELAVPLELELTYNTTCQSLRIE
jgi:hypothetical protein